MVAAGNGDLFLAHNARKIMVLDLEGERMTVNGDNILAFGEGIDWDIVPLAGAGRLAGGAFNVILEGTGKVAVTAQGDPVLLDTSTPTSATPTRRSPGAAASAPGSSPTSPSIPSWGGTQRRPSRSLSRARGGC